MTWGGTPLRLAVYKHRHGAVRMLWDAGAKTDVTIPRGVAASFVNSPLLRLQSMLLAWTSTSDAAQAVSVKAPVLTAVLGTRYQARSWRAMLPAVVANLAEQSSEETQRAAPFVGTEVVARSPR